VEALGACEGCWDRSRLSQAVSNLAANALQHGDAKTPVTLRTQGTGDRVLLEVHNSGPAIAPADLSGIFEPFRRSGKGNTGGNGSLGLGLYIVREIVTAHGGTIDVSSSADAGTTFRVNLPRSPPASDETAGGRDVP
jgi:signal transduction histidine kinase